MDLAKYIDHSILKPNHTLKDLESQIIKCIEKGVYGVCVNSFWVKRAAEISSGKVVVCSVVSFPFGTDTKEAKLYSSLRALEDGASELDIVVNISAVKSGLWDYVNEEINSIARNTQGFVRKFIIETAYLTDEEKIRLLHMLMDAGVEFVKTSTGYAPMGATKEDLLLLIREGKGEIKIKASGGIRTKDQALEFIKLGAQRIGTSVTFEIL